MSKRNRMGSQTSIGTSSVADEANSVDAGAIRPEQEGGESGFWATRQRGPLFHGVLPMGYGFSADEVAAASDAAAPEFSEDLFGLTLRSGRELDSRRELALDAGVDAGEFQEFVATRLGQLNRQLSDMHASGARRVAELRRESRFLLLALGAALVFCLVAFYLTQVQVREVREGILSEVQQASDRAEERLASSFEDLHSRQLPALRTRLQAMIEENRDQDSKRLKSMEAELRQVGDQNAVHLGEALRILEDQLWRVRSISEEVRVLQKELLERNEAVARPGDSSAGPASRSRQFADSSEDKSP